MFDFYFRQQWRALWTTPMRVAIVATYAALAAWALADGLRWVDQLQTIQSTTPADLLTDRDAWFADLEKAEAGEDISPYAARPMSLTFQALHKPGPLAALAHRGEAIHPHSALINGWHSEASLFHRYEVEGPSSLRLGRLDYIFVVTVLFPLFLLMLTFDVVSTERSGGRLRLFLVQGGSVVALLGARLTAALIPLVAISAVGIVLATLVTGASYQSMALWLLLVALYALFWSALAALIATLFKSPSSGALAVLAAWSLLVVFVPSASQFAAQAIFPVPSRVAYLTQARIAEGETRRNLTQRAEIYMAEHPGQANTSDDAVPGYYRASYLSNIDINDKTRPIVEAFEAQQTAQRELLTRIRYVSPTIAIQDVLHHASGTGTKRAAEFRRQARDHLNMVLERIGPATVNRSRLSVEAAQAIPPFQFQPQGLTWSNWSAIVWTLAMTAGIAIAAIRRARWLN